MSGAPGSLAPRPSGLATARLVVLALALGAWVLPWVDAFPRFTGDVRTETGASRTGAVAALAFVAAWGLAATARVARTLRGAQGGEAATALGISAVVAALIALEHPWLPGGDHRSGWLPIFVPLGLLCALEIAVRARREGAGGEVTAIRAGSALMAALALAVARQPIPAAAALAVALGGATTLLPATESGVRRAQHALAALAGVVLLLAPRIRASIAALPPLPPPVRETATPVAFAACAGLLCALTVAHAFARPPSAPAS